MKILVFILFGILISSCADTENKNKVVDLRSGEEIEDDLRVPQGDGEIEGKSESESEEQGESEGKNALRVPQGTGTGEWTYKVVMNSEKNWGYQLFQNGKMIINQTTIPSVQGMAGFDSQEKAERTAKHIISKLEKGVFPPTVDKKELDSLKVLRD